MDSAKQQKMKEIWELHCKYEFDDHDLAATMDTMVDEPYVNHIPTMTGGVGKQKLTEFYRDNFISKLPPDTKLIPVSQTIGENRLVDELIFCFTHDREIDFLLPGLKPTHKYVKVPTVAIVTFEGDKIANEHIYWDQASVLVQIGLLNPEGLPVAGVETAEKVLDKTLPSNSLLASSS